MALSFGSRRGRPWTSRCLLRHSQNCPFHSPTETILPLDPNEDLIVSCTPPGGIPIGKRLVGPQFRKGMRLGTRPTPMCRNGFVVEEDVHVAGWRRSLIREPELMIRSVWKQSDRFHPCRTLFCLIRRRRGPLPRFSPPLYGCRPERNHDRNEQNDEVQSLKEEVEHSWIRLSFRLQTALRFRPLLHRASEPQSSASGKTRKPGEPTKTPSDGGYVQKSAR